MKLTVSGVRYVNKYLAALCSKCCEDAGVPALCVAASFFYLTVTRRMMVRAADSFGKVNRTMGANEPK